MAETPDGPRLSPERQCRRKHFMRVDLFDFAHGVAANHVFHYDQITGPGDGVVGLCRHNKPKDLQLRSYIELALCTIEKDLAQIGCSPLWSNRPKYIRQVLGPVHVCGLQIVEFHLDLDVALFALHFGLAPRPRQEFGAAKIDLRRTATVLVINCLRGSRCYGDAINRWPSGYLLGGIRALILRPLSR